MLPFYSLCFWDFRELPQDLSHNSSTCDLATGEWRCVTDTTETAFSFIVTSCIYLFIECFFGAVFPMFDSWLVICSTPNLAESLNLWVTPEWNKIATDQRAWHNPCSQSREPVKDEKPEPVSPAVKFHDISHKSRSEQRSETCKQLEKLHLLASWAKCNHRRPT